MNKEVYYSGTGKRKSAIAQVKLYPGIGTIVVNGVPYDERFTRQEHLRKIVHPFLVTDSIGKYNTMVKVFGGGVSGQCAAISHGIARALVRADEHLKPTLRQNGLITRDPRVKERKKPGLKRARKAPQYTKR